MTMQTLKKPNIASKGFYIILMLLLFSAISAVVLIESLSSTVTFLLMQLACLLLGFVHVQFLPTYFPRLWPESFLRSTLTTLALNVGGVASLALTLRLLDGSPALASSALLFSLPYFVVAAFRYFRRIPAPEYKTWYYPLGSAMPDLDLLDLTKILVVQLEFPKQPADDQPTNFKAKAPVDMRFGELFFIFINDYNEQHPNSPIVYLDEQKNPFGWVFYRKTAWWQGRKYFDPDLTFKENGAADNEIIVCERV